MKDLIASIKKTTKLYKQPSRLGDIIKCNDKKWLVIGMQDVRFHVYGSALTITYVCQNLEQEFLYQPAAPKQKDNLVECIIKVTTGKSREFNDDFSLGKLFWIDGLAYQSVEYTDVEIKFTDVVVSFLARPIRPISQKEAKAKLLNEKKKELNLSLL